VTLAQDGEKTVLELWEPLPFPSPALNPEEILIFFGWQCKEPWASFFRTGPATWQKKYNQNQPTTNTFW
jgi:hypothetical protein